MNRSQPEVNPVYQAFETDRIIPTEIQIKQMAREREKYKLLDIIDYEEADAAQDRCTNKSQIPELKNTSFANTRERGLYVTRAVILIEPGALWQLFNHKVTIIN